MSNDQRPSRVTLIDTGASDRNARRRASDVGKAPPVAAAPSPAAPPARKAGTLLWAALFLLACGTGAAGVSLMPLIGAR